MKLSNIIKFIKFKVSHFSVCTRKLAFVKFKVTFFSFVEYSDQFINFKASFSLGKHQKLNIGSSLES